MHPDLDVRDRGRYAWFGYGAWTPTIPGWGQGTYSLLYYDQPSVTVQPIASDGSVVQRRAADRRPAGNFHCAPTRRGAPSFAIQSSIAAAAS